MKKTKSMAWYLILQNLKRTKDYPLKKGIELLTTPGLKQVWQRRRQELLEDKIDVTNFMVWFVEH